MAGRPRKKEPEAGGRERLLAAAACLFAAKGYAATSVRDILKAAKVTAPVLYYHFGSKEGLFIGLFRHGIEMFDAEVAEALAGARTAGAKVRAFCRAHIEVHRRFANLRRVVEAALAGPASAAPRLDVKKPFAHIITQLADLVSAAVKSGEFHRCDPTAAALALLGAVEMTLRARRINLRLPGGADRFDGVLAVVIDGLRARPRPRRTIAGRGR